MDSLGIVCGLIMTILVRLFYLFNWICVCFLLSNGLIWYHHPCRPKSRWNGSCRGHYYGFFLSPSANMDFLIKIVWQLRVYVSTQWQIITFPHATIMYKATLKTSRQETSWIKEKLLIASNFELALTFQNSDGKPQYMVIRVNKGYKSMTFCLK